MRSPQSSPRQCLRCRRALKVACIPLPSPPFSLCICRPCRMNLPRKSTSRCSRLRHLKLLVATLLNRWEHSPLAFISQASSCVCRGSFKVMLLISWLRSRPAGDVSFQTSGHGQLPPTGKASDKGTKMARCHTEPALPPGLWGSWCQAGQGPLAEV